MIVCLCMRVLTHVNVCVGLEKLEAKTLSPNHFN